MRITKLLLAGGLVLGGCMPSSKAPEPTAPPGTAAFFEQQRANCAARGGTFGNAPGDASKICFITPKDANQACRQGSDCEGHCLARSQTCAPVTPLFGCHEVLLSGGRRATVCLD